MRMLMAALLMIAGVAAGTLEDFRWKKRLLVVSGNPGGLREKLAELQPELESRDVELFFLNDPKIDKALAAQLVERLKVRPELAEVILLGKDGRTTLRWKAAEFTPAALFAKIDAMPMRQAEMRERKAGD